MEITCTVGYGKANLSTTLATYASMKVSPPFQRVSAATSGRAMGSRSTVQVGDWEPNGVLISVPVSHPSGTIILLQSKWMRRGVAFRDGAMFLRLRPGAAVYNIIASVPTGHENRCGDSFIMFAGPADIMTLDELRLVNLDVPRGYAERFANVEELSECYRIVRVSPETIPRPSISAVATPTGIEMRELASEPRRRIVIRR